MEGGTQARDGVAPSESSPIFVWGPLEAIEKIGEGSFGEVFRAFDPLLQRELALKLARRIRGRRDLRPDAHLDEARRLARVRHPNVLIVHGVAIHDRRPGMWTDYIRGRTLEELLVEEGPFAPGEILRISINLCRALAAVHAADLCHGDVKTSNVMREAGGRIVLMDFGAGADLRGDRNRGRSSPSSITGTPLVMAPELFEGASLRATSDIYSMGVLLYRLATGRYPITAVSRGELIARLREGSHIPVAESRPELLPHLADAIERALRIDPAGRFQSATEMRAVLESGAPDAPEGGAVKHPPHLPHELGRFIGRERELGEVRRLILEHRMVTLIGAGGSGKTRLALRAAIRLDEVLPHGTRWVNLAPLSAPELLAQGVAHQIGVKEEGSDGIEERLIDHLREREVLLVLDNCEHLRAGATSLIDRLLRECPRVRILATSREDLGVAGEKRIAVGSMQTPPPRSPNETPEGTEIAEYESVLLFVDRARGSRPDFVLTPGNAPDVSRICRRLDGIPLAVELAAARVRVLDTAQIASRLDESFKLLTGGRQDGLPHHKTIQACIDWSYQILAREEQTLLRRLSLFADQWSLDAAERVCADPGGVEAVPMIGAREVADVHLGLVEKSLLLARAGEAWEPDSRRPSERLDPSEGIRIRKLQLGYYLDLVDRAEPDMSTQREVAWFTLFEAEHENLRSILEWCCDSGEELDRAIRLAIGLRRFWLVQGYLKEGRGHIERLLRSDAGSPSDRARLLHATASLAVAQADLDGTTDRGERALAAYRALGDRKGIAAVLSILGFMSIEKAEYDIARDRLEESIAIDRELGNKGPIPNRLNSLAIIAARLGNFLEAERRFQEALDLFRDTGDLRGTAVMLGNLSTQARNLGQPERARALAEESLSITRSIGPRADIGKALRTMAMARIQARDFAGARSDFVEALQIERGTENPVQIIWCLEGMGQLEEDDGHPSRAVRIFAAADALRELSRIPLPAPDRRERENAILRLREALGDPAFTSLWASGRAMTRDEVIDFARSAPE
jgi:non-specific serine/threonine protein kinase